MICPYFTEPQFFFYVPDLPVLIYYSFVPAMVIAFLVAVIVIVNDRKALLNQLLCAIALSFLVWTFCTFIGWTNIHSGTILFTWSLLGPAAGLVSIFCIYFAHVFLQKQDVGLWLKVIFLALLAPLFVLAPSWNTLSGFNLSSCDAFGFEGVMNTFYFPALGVLAMIWILVLIIRNYRVCSKEMRKEIVLMGTGIELFLLSLFTTEFLGQYLTTIGVLPDSQIETYGYFGMIIFIIYITILIVRFKAFHVNLIASQALILALLVLIGAQLTFVRNTTSIVLTGIALVLTAIIGWILVRSIQKEITQREHIEALARDLETANRQQATLLRFISHQLKGYVAKARNVFSLLLEGDYGAIPDTARELVNQGFTSSTQGAKTIQDILDASNMKSGKMAYMNADFDLKDLVQSIVTAQKPSADAKGVALTLTAPDEPLTFNGDRAQLENALRNLIDNTIKYTPTGSINVTLVKDGSTIRFTTEDTGVGITPEDMKNLFTEGGHGAESQKVNVESTGFGLYIVKNIIEAHKGKVWAESAGAGKGSKFVVELPAA